MLEINANAVFLTKISHTNYHNNLKQTYKNPQTTGFCISQQMVLWCNELVQEYKKYTECEHLIPLPGAAAFLVAGLAAGGFAGS